MLNIPLRNVYLILITISSAAVLGRITTLEDYSAVGLETYRINRALEVKTAQWKARGFSEESIAEKRQRYYQENVEKLQTRRPTLSANDRSRWALIRALVEPEMRVPGAPYAIDRVIAQRGWDTIDMVKHNGHLYSSKPPLLPTIQAGIYWTLVQTTGMTCQTHPFQCVRIVTALSHLPCLILFFVMVILTVQQLTISSFARVFIASAACLGTYLTTFAISLQNHLPGAAAVAVALYAIVKIVLDNPLPFFNKTDNSAEPVNESRFYSLRGGSGRSLLIYFIAGLFSCFAIACELPALAFFAAIALVCTLIDWRKTLTAFLPGCLIVLAGFLITNYAAHKTIIPPYAQRQEGNNWYMYTYDRGDGVIRQSYWHNRVGIDKGEPSRARYAFHALFGHHGIFSLTPLWTFSIAGAFIWICRWKTDKKMAALGFFILSMSIIVIGFYLMRPLIDRNYGGVTCAFRWAFWLIPLWLIALIPVLEKARSNKWLTGAVYAALFWSVLCANTALVNPWTHPWLYY